MNANELRIGNKILFIICDKEDSKLDEKKEITVDISDFEFIRDNDSLFEGIPLTEEWLLKFGFVNNHEYTYTLYFNCVFGYLNELEFFFEPNEDVCITLRQKDISEKEKESIFLNKLEYAHQLQNLYFALTNEELTLKT